MTKDRELSFSIHKYRIDTKASQATSMRQMMLKTVTLVLVEHINGKQPFLVSDDDIELGDTVCELTAPGAWVLAATHANKDSNLALQKKIVATPDQIGYLVYRDTAPAGWPDAESSTLTRQIGPNDISLILDRNGKCAIEMETFEGAYCGFRTVRFEDGKVLIHLKDADKH